jgi:hypothetical protein
VTDAESPAMAIAVTGSSSNPALVDLAGINVAGDSTNRTVTVTPLANQLGTAVISLRAADPEGNATTNSFLLTVNRLIEPPRILFIMLSGTSATLAFTTQTDADYRGE